jgi:hypothetical protein
MPSPEDLANALKTVQSLQALVAQQIATKKAA